MPTCFVAYWRLTFLCMITFCLWISTFVPFFTIWLVFWLKADAMFIYFDIAIIQVLNNRIYLCLFLSADVLFVCYFRSVSCGRKQTSIGRGPGVHTFLGSTSARSFQNKIACGRPLVPPHPPLSPNGTVTPSAVQLSRPWTWPGELTEQKCLWFSSLDSLYQAV